MSPNVAPTVDAAERKRARDRDYRRRRRATDKQVIADRQPDLFPVTLAVVNEPPPVSATLDDVRARLEAMMGDTSPVSRDARDPPSLKEKFPPAPPSKENNPSPKIDDEDRARAVSMISPEAKNLADQLGRIAGLDPDPMACPPGWCGAAMQVQSWLNSGWAADAILVGARTAMKRKRDGPPDTVAYFTREVAKIVAQMRRPPPIIEVSTRPEVIHVRSGPAATGWQARRDAGFEALATLDERLAEFDRATGGSG